MMTRKGYGNHKFIYDWIIQNNPTNILEIGIANGENASKMIKKSLKNKESINYFGFDKFKENSKKEIKKKLQRKDAKINLFEGDTKKTLPKNVNELPKMDLVFIDGGHDYETVKNDWKYTKKVITEKTMIFFHNYDFSGVKKLSMK